MDVFINLIVVIISQSINISKHHIIHLKLTQCYVSYLKTGKRKIQKWSKAQEKMLNITISKEMQIKNHKQNTTRITKIKTNSIKFYNIHGTNGNCHVQ